MTLTQAERTHMGPLLTDSRLGARCPIGGHDMASSLLVTGLRAFPPRVSALLTEKAILLCGSVWAGLGLADGFIFLSVEWLCAAHHPVDCQLDVSAVEARSVHPP